jgi:hypothetical protein
VFPSLNKLIEEKKRKKRKTIAEKTTFLVYNPRIMTCCLSNTTESNNHLKRVWIRTSLCANAPLFFYVDPIPVREAVVSSSSFLI